MLATLCQCGGGPSSLSQPQSWHSLLPLLGTPPLPQHLLWAVSNFLPSPHPPSFYLPAPAWALVAPTLQSERARGGGWEVLNPSAFYVCTLGPQPQPLTLPTGQIR